MSLAESIFGAAAGHVSGTSSGSFSTSGLSLTTRPLSFVVPASSVSGSDAAWTLPTQSLPSFPAQGSIAGTPEAADNFTLVAETLAWADPVAAVVPTYGVPVEPGSLPAATIPAAPALVQQGMEGVTRSAGLTTFVKPAIAIGDRPGLLDVELAAFDVESISPLDLDTPAYVPLDMDAEELSAPQPLSYTNDAALIARIQTTLSGSDVLNAAERELLYDALLLEQGRDDMLAVRKVMSDMAARGFSMPLGAANELVAGIAYQGRSKRQDAAVKVRDEAYERAKQLLTDAFTKAIALEAKHFALHLAYCGKLIETLKFNVQMKATLFNGVVELFNQKAAFVRTVVGAYKEYVRALEAQDDAVVAQLRGEMAKATSYRAKVEMFSAQTGTLKTFAEVEALGVEQQVQVLQEYEAYLVGVRANVETVKRNIEAYRLAIGTLRDVADVESGKVSAYAEQVGAFNSVADVYSANVGAFAGFWKAESARSNAYGSYVDESAKVLNARARAFGEYSSAQRSYVGALSAKVDAELDRVRGFSTAARALTGYVSTYNKAQGEVSGAKNAESLNNATLNVLNQTLQANADAENARIQASLQAIETMRTSATEAAKRAVRSVSVTLRGEVSGDERDNTSNSLSTSNATSHTTKYTTEH